MNVRMLPKRPDRPGLRDARPSLPALRRPADLAHPAVPDTEAGQDRAMQAGDEGLDGLRAQRGGAAQAGEAGGAAVGARATVTLPWPPKDLSPNARIHWAKLAKVKKAYRHACCTLAWQAGIGGVFDGCARLHVALVFYPPDRRQRDQDNMFAAMKAGLDGLADAMRVDDRKFRATFEVADQIGGMVKVTVKPMESAKHEEA